MTKQEIFNKVVRGLAKQEFRRSRIGNYCAYRSRDGRKCAAGHLMNDEHYRHEFNQEVVDSHGPREALKKSGVSEKQLDFVSSLQDAHDDNETPDAMKSALVRAARYYKLKLPPVLR